MPLSNSKPLMNVVFLKNAASDKNDYRIVILTNPVRTQGQQKTAAKASPSLFCCCKTAGSFRLRLILPFIYPAQFCMITFQCRNTARRFQARLILPRIYSAQFCVNIFQCCNTAGRFRAHLILPLRYHAQFYVNFFQCRNTAISLQLHNIADYVYFNAKRVSPSRKKLFSVYWYAE